MDVILVILDDVGRGDFEAIPTPCIDALTELRFTRAYAMPLCSQTRKSLTFGRYFTRDAGGFAVAGPDTPDRTWYSIGGMFQSAGFSTGMFGKWHMGFYPPSSYGYDVWRAGRHSNFTGIQDYLNWNRIDDGVETFSTEYAGEADTDALNVWWSATVGEKFAVLSLPQPHSPRHQPPSHLLPPSAPPATTEREKFEQMIMAADSMVGELPSADIVIVFGDNGSGKGVGGEKFEVTELGVNVPMVGCGLGASGTSNRLVHVVDILPTLGRLSGAPNPCAEVTSLLDGTDLIEGPAHETIFVGADKDGKPPRYAAIQEQWKLIRKGPDKLYDLLSDSEEQSPIDPDSEPTVRDELAEFLEKYI